MSESYHQRAVKHYAPRKPSILYECKICGKEGLVKYSHWLKGSGKYCGKKCAAIGIGKQNTANFQANRKLSECLVCKKKFYLKPKDRLENGNYCSYKCRGIGYSNRYKGEMNPNFKNWSSHGKRKIIGSHLKSDIQKIWEIQNGECLYCHESLFDNFHIDHIIPIKKGGTNYVGNIQLLCIQCNLRKNAMLPIEFKLKTKSSEDDEQAALIKWWDFIGHKKFNLPIAALFHIPNGGYRHIRTAVNMKKTGVRKGVFDLLLMAQRNGFNGLWIEMKYGKNKLTQEQEAFSLMASAVGYECVVCWSWEDARNKIEDYLCGRN